jgi:hypothetical protein
MAQCVYSNSCECGRSYIGERGHPLAVQLHEHRQNLKKSHRVGWDEARSLETEHDSRYRKYKESAHMTCSTTLISQPSVDISPI